MSQKLVEANQLGLDVLTGLMGNVSEGQTRFEGKSLSPAVLVSDPHNEI